MVFSSPIRYAYKKCLGIAERGLGGICSLNFCNLRQPRSFRLVNSVLLENLLAVLFSFFAFISKLLQVIPRTVRNISTCSFVSDYVQRFSREALTSTISLPELLKPLDHHTDSCRPPSFERAALCKRQPIRMSNMPLPNDPGQALL